MDMNITFNKEYGYWELYWVGIFITHDKNKYPLEVVRDRMMLALARHDEQKHPQAGGYIPKAVDYEVGTPPRVR